MKTKGYVLNQLRLYRSSLTKDEYHYIRGMVIAGNTDEALKRLQGCVSAHYGK